MALVDVIETKTRLELDIEELKYKIESTLLVSEDVLRKIRKLYNVHGKTAIEEALGVKDTEALSNTYAALKQAILYGAEKNVADLITNTSD